MFRNFYGFILLVLAVGIVNCDSNGEVCNECVEKACGKMSYTACFPDDTGIMGELMSGKKFEEILTRELTEEQNLVMGLLPGFEVHKSDLDYTALNSPNYNIKIMLYELYNSSSCEMASITDIEGEIIVVMMPLEDPNTFTTSEKQFITDCFPAINGTSIVDTDCRIFTSASTGENYMGCVFTVLPLGYEDK